MLELMVYVQILYMYTLMIQSSSTIIKSTRVYHCIMNIVGTSLGVPVHVFGTETHMTAIVGMALGKTVIPDQEPFDSNDAATMFFDSAEVLSCEF